MLQLHDLPADCAAAVLAALSPAQRCRAACVCRAWRLLVTLPCAWASLDLRDARPSVDAVRLRALAGRATGALRFLGVRAGTALPPADVIAVALSADPGALAELRVSAPPSPADSDAEEADDDAEGGEAEVAARAAAWRVPHAAALHAVPRLALPLVADALDGPLASLLAAGRVHALSLERANVGPVETAALVDAALAATEGEEAAGEEARRRCSSRVALRALSLRLNAVGDAGAASLARLAPQLTRLQLGWNDVSDAGAAALAAALTPCSGSGRGSILLRELDLRHCAVGPTGGAALARCLAAGAPLARLSLLHNRLGADGATALAAALRRSACTLLHLDLAHNGLGRRGITALARADLGRLRSLGLAYNACCAGGARELARALARNATLTRLDVGRNALGDEGVRELCIALRGHATLTCLRAPVVAAGPEAARRLGGLLRNCAALTALDVSGNALGAGVAALAAGLADGGGALRTLRLAATGADDRGAHALAAALRAGAGGAGLARLDLRSNPVGDDGARALAAAAGMPSARIARIDLRGTFLGATDKGAAELRRAVAARGGALTLLGLPPL